jgi:hypothetical protein
MQKMLSIVFLGFITLSLQSCTRTCTCEDPNGEIHELEIDPAESCSDRSGELLGVCY